MTQKDNILQELKELESTLANHPAQNTYTVPGGYFEGLVAQTLNRIKALEATTASEELSFLSATLNNISKETVYTVPAGYFEGLEEKILQSVSRDNNQTAKEELETLSPLLSGLKKEIPYAVPAGYFDSLQTKQETKVVSITSHKWFRYAVAAVMVGVVATVALLINNSQRSFDKFVAKVDKEIKKASDKELIEFVELTDASRDMAVNGSKEDVKELLKDIPAAELQEFLEEVAEPGIDNNTSSLE